MTLRNVTGNVCGVLPFAIVLMALTSVTSAQQVVRDDGGPATAVQPTVAVNSPAATQPMAVPPQATVAAQPVYYYYEPATDPYGFVSWLNATRAQYGLSAVGHDPNLTNWAAVNNSHQAYRGMGHYVMGPARRQNSAMGNYANIGAMWMGSGPHRAALLDPTIRFVGIAGAGAYWTFNAY